jgi:hypothetical protein
MSNQTNWRIRPRWYLLAWILLTLGLALGANVLLKIEPFSSLVILASSLSLVGLGAVALLSGDLARSPDNFAIWKSSLRKKNK